MSTISRFRSRHQTLALDGGGPPPNPPETPASFAVAGSTFDEISLSWDLSDGANYYELAIGPSGGPYVPVADNPFFGTGGSVGDLDPETEYCLQVRSCNAGGCSAWSPEVCDTTATAPGVIGHAQIGHAVIG